MYKYISILLVLIISGIACTNETKTPWYHDYHITIENRPKIEETEEMGLSLKTKIKINENRDSLIFNLKIHYNLYDPHGTYLQTVTHNVWGRNEYTCNKFGQCGPEPLHGTIYPSSTQYRWQIDWSKPSRPSSKKVSHYLWTYNTYPPYKTTDACLVPPINPYSFPGDVCKKGSMVYQTHAIILPLHVNSEIADAIKYPEQSSSTATHTLGR